MIFLLWFATASILFGFAAWEALVLVLAIYTRCRGLTPYDPVKISLSEDERVAVDKIAHKLAILIPANHEVANRASQRQFEANLEEIIRQTPGASSVFVLFDSSQTQAENERNAIQAVRERLRASGDSHRLYFEEDRNRPRELKTKPGNLDAWFRKYRGRFEYAMVLDADSSLRPADPADQAGSNVVWRLLQAMEHGNPQPAMIQTVIRIRHPQTYLGWMQCEESNAGATHSLIWALVLGKHAACYGHNFICRAELYQQHLRLDYLSHDMIESASLSAADQACYFTNQAVTFEAPEEPLMSWLKRDRRWSRGNTQWLVYLLRKDLPWQAALFLVLGIGEYVTQLAGCWFLLLSVMALNQGIPLFAGNEIVAGGLFLSVLFLPVAIRWFSNYPMRKVFFSLALRFLIGSGLMWIRALYFLTGPVSNQWIARGPRQESRRWERLETAACMLPPALIGMVLLWKTLESGCLSFGSVLVLFTLGTMVLSPLTAVVLSGELNPQPPREKPGEK